MRVASIWWSLLCGRWTERSNMRLDQYLVKEGLCATRQKAVFAIKEGLVLLNGRVCQRASADTERKTVELLGQAFPYVSRGGLKLSAAIKDFSPDVQGKVCLDLGASTGGFTQCLLEHGAKRVYALDVGKDQLHESLKSDARVISMEQFNARELCADSLPEQIDLAVSDLSFISQSYIYAPLVSVLKEGAPFISLIKPQFEAGRASLNKKGVVSDLRDHLRVIKELCEKASAQGLTLVDLSPSPILGGDGNREYLALFRYKDGCPIGDQKIREAVFGSRQEYSKE
ncbi:MAG: TlyA family RNA methyltransferase [Clostridia bacterium]|nr:TlyA family RNA methyltransferase [Clostridia bacterium]